jgi:hypothetical protein
MTSARIAFNERRKEKGGVIITNVHFLSCIAMPNKVTSLEITRV